MMCSRGCPYTNHQHLIHSVCYFQCKFSSELDGAIFNGFDGCFSGMKLIQHYFKQFDSQVETDLVLKLQYLQRIADQELLLLLTLCSLAKTNSVGCYLHPWKHW